MFIEISDDRAKESLITLIVLGIRFIVSGNIAVALHGREALVDFPDLEIIMKMENNLSSKIDWVTHNVPAIDFVTFSAPPLDTFNRLLTKCTKYKTISFDIDIISIDDLIAEQNKEVEHWKMELDKHVKDLKHLQEKIITV